MPAYRVEKATMWGQVEEAATLTARCIRPDLGTNWERAKQTWEKLGNDVVYFIIRWWTYPNAIVGYARLFNTTPSSAYSNNPTWALDYIWPSSAEAVVLIADELPGNVLIKSLFSADPLTRHWPKMALSLAIPEAPYRIHSDKVSDWHVVIK